jgi:hypothetical protein
MSATESESEKGLPSITVYTDAYDATLVVAKTLRLTEKLDFPVSIDLRRHESVEVIIILTAVATTISTQLVTRFADDLYDYMKKRTSKVLEEGRKMQVDTNEQWNNLKDRQPEEKPRVTPELLQLYSEQRCPNCGETLPSTAFLVPGIFTHDVCGKDVTVSAALVHRARRIAEERLRRKHEGVTFLRSDLRTILPPLRNLTNVELERLNKVARSDLRTLTDLAREVSQEVERRRDDHRNDTTSLGISF